MWVRVLEYQDGCPPVYAGQVIDLEEERARKLIAARAAEPVPPPHAEPAASH